MRAHITSPRRDARDNDISSARVKAYFCQFTRQGAKQPSTPPTFRIGKLLRMHANINAEASPFRLLGRCFSLRASDADLPVERANA